MHSESVFFLSNLSVSEKFTQMKDVEEFVSSSEQILTN